MSSLHPGIWSERGFTTLYKGLVGDGPKDEERHHDEDRAFKWLAIGTEIPIMVFLGALIGYNFGKRFGSPYEFVGLTFGAFFGFIISLIPLFREASGRRRRKR